MSKGLNASVTEMMEELFKTSYKEQLSKSIREGIRKAKLNKAQKK